MTPADKAIKQFIKQLDSLDRSLSTREKFRDLCELAYCAFAKTTAPTPERADDLEARYMSIVNRYQDKDTIRAYPELIGIAINAVKDGGCDFLGVVSSQLEVLDVHNGQFFTPYDLAVMMAQVTLGDAGQIIERELYITMQEPAAGAGGMVLAYADELQKQGYDPGWHLLVNAIDISPLCYWMCYLQLTWRGIPALVERANTLSLERFESAWTPSTVDFYAQHGRLFDKPVGEPVQFSLFAEGIFG